MQLEHRVVMAPLTRSRSVQPGSIPGDLMLACHCSQLAGANGDFGDEGAVDWAFLGNLKQLRALLLG
jgi:hypothetical protein